MSLDRQFNEIALKVAKRKAVVDYLDLELQMAQALFAKQAAEMYDILKEVAEREFPGCIEITDMDYIKKNLRPITLEYIKHHDVVFIYEFPEGSINEHSAGMRFGVEGCEYYSGLK